MGKDSIVRIKCPDCGKTVLVLDMAADIVVKFERCEQKQRAGEPDIEVLRAYNSDLLVK